MGDLGASNHIIQPGRTLGGEQHQKESVVISLPSTESRILTARQVLIDYSKGQKDALLRSADLIDAQRARLADPLRLVICGFAGVGKTTIVENMVRYGQESGLRVGLLAPTNRAIQVLRNKFPAIFHAGNSRTIHSALYGPPDEKGDFRIGQPNLLTSCGDVIIIDESSMITHAVLNDLMESARKSNVKIIFLGDNFQLPPVESNRDDVGKQRLLENPDVLLTEVRRQAGGSTVLELATVMRYDNRIVIPNQDYGEVRIFNEAGSKLFAKLYRENNGDVAYIVGKNSTRVNANLAIRNELYSEGVARQNALLEGENIISISNNQHHTNGSIFKVKEILGYDGQAVAMRKVWKDGRPTFQTEHYHRYRVVDDNGRIFRLFLFPETTSASIHNGEISELTRKGPFGKKVCDTDVVIGTYGNAISAHKSQGGQWGSVMVELEARFNEDPRWAYTAVTRAAKTVYIKLNDAVQPFLVEPSNISERFKEATKDNT